MGTLARNEFILSVSVINDSLHCRQVLIFVSMQYSILTAQKMKFSIKDFFSKCDQIRRKLRIWSHLPKKFLMENFIFCAVSATIFR